MGDVMDDNAALKRRSNMPTRIATQGPQEKARQILRRGGNKSTRQNKWAATRTTYRQSKKIRRTKEMAKNNTKGHLHKRKRKRGQTEMHRIRKWARKEKETETDIGTAHPKRSFLDHAYQQVDT